MSDALLFLHVLAAFLLMGTVAVLLVGLCFGFLVRARLQGAAKA